MTGREHVNGQVRVVRWIRGLLRRGLTQEAASEDAQHLLDAYGPYAYREARNRARTAREDRWTEGNRHWSRVARAIAKSEGREIGVKTADRYGL